MTSQTPQPTKTCHMCCMDVPAAAKKCPHCCHFLSKSIFLWPGIYLVLILVVLGLFGAMMNNTFDPGESFQSYAGQVEFTQTRLEHGETKTGPTVAIIGMMKNKSPIPWKDVQFHVQFSDANGRVIDASQKLEYFRALAPANEELALKLSFLREFPQTNYVNYTVRVIGAKDARSRW